MFRKCLKVFVSCAILLALVPGCGKTDKITGPADSGKGVALVKISVTAGSIFQHIADSAMITVSASDMLTIKQKLTVTDTSVEGRVEGIPAGNARLFTLAVYDSLDTLQYRGSASADIIADSVAHITITIVRMSGGAVINTIINESDSIPTAGLVAYYPFNGNARDESGNGNDGVVYGATLGNDRFNDANHAYEFNGVSSYIETPPESAYDFGTGDFTYSGWFNSRKANTIASIILSASWASGAGIGSSEGVVLDVQHDSVYVQGRTPDGLGVYTGAQCKVLNEWHQVALTREKGVLQGSLDGVPYGKPDMQATASYVGHKLNRIGVTSGRFTYWFDGLIDDIRIYNRALSESEIQRLYHEGGWTGN